MRRTILAVIAVIGFTFYVAATIATGQTPGSIKIGVVDQEKVLNDSAEGKRLNAELQKLRSAKMTAIDAKEKEISGIQEQLLRASGTLSDDKRDDLSRQLKRKRIEYERLNDDANAEFQEAGGRAQARLISIFRDIVTKYASEKGFTVILEKGSIYFASPTVGITDEVLARFNAAVPAGAASQPKNK